jgi:hypothetical protein
VVFLLLCFLTFAAISLTTANSDLSASKDYADRQNAYYDACNRAEEKICDLNHDAAVHPDSAALAAHFKEKVDNKQSLHIALILKDGKYQITRWQIVTENEWGTDTEQTFPLLHLDEEDGE